MSAATTDTRGRWLRKAEAAAFCLGTALILLHSAARIGAETARAQGIDTFQDAKARSEANTALARERVPESDPTGSLDPPGIDQSLWSPQRVIAFERSRQSTDAPRAVLRIPSLDLGVPVYADTGELNLNRGAGHIEGTAPLGTMGNTGIAGHRDGFFRKLEHIDLGADVLIDIGPQELRYRVSSVEIVQPTDVHVLAETGEPSITLVTCYPFYFLGPAPQRFIVRAEAVDLQPAESTASRPNERPPNNRNEEI